MKDHRMVFTIQSWSFKKSSKIGLKGPKITSRFFLHWLSQFKSLILTKYIWSPLKHPPEMFYNKATVNFTIFTGKHLCCIIFSLFKRDSNIGVFLWILRNLYKHLYWKTYGNGCFRILWSSDTLKLVL